jgi:hypothetical protein
VSGKVNVYTCPECKGEMVTVDVDEGTTPFMLGCRATAGCKGLAESSFYRPRPGHAPPALEWYRPSAAEMKKASPAMREHAGKGG